MCVHACVRVCLKLNNPGRRICFDQPCVCSQAWLINVQRCPVYGMHLPSGFQLIGQMV